MLIWLKLCVYVFNVGGWNADDLPLWGAYCVLPLVILSYMHFKFVLEYDIYIQFDPIFPAIKFRI